MNVRRALVQLTVLLLNLYLLVTIFVAVVGRNEDAGADKYHEDESEDGENSGQKEYAPKVDKIVLMIIDAMRFDFVPVMTFVSSLLKERDNACLFKVDLEGPTVTLPRIKALITGSSSSYWDFLANLKQSSGMSDDNILSRAKVAGKEIVFYGDDTWLKLFPEGVFKRSEGVTSFFVTDFYEVDNNVTRNVDRELEAVEFDLMILHYLGVDHVGHVHGPKHPLIREKLAEMDSIIQKVYNRLLSTPVGNPHLMLITGDHGMATVGGHGGDSVPEVTTPLIAISIGRGNRSVHPVCNPPPEKWYQEAYKLRQNDVATTFSFLWDLPFPGKARGVIAQEIMSRFPAHLQLASLLKNARHLLKFIPKDTAPAEKIFRRFTKLNQEFGKMFASSVGSEPSSKYSSETILSECKSLISQIQSLVVNNTEQDVLTMMLSSVLLLQLVFILLCELPHSGSKCKSCLYAILCIGLYNVLRSGLPVLLIMCSLFLWSMRYELYKRISSMEKTENSGLLWFGSSVIYFSSSFVEEEHYVVYFLYSTCIVICALEESVDQWSYVILLVLHRLCSSLNSTGQKWNYLPDLNFYAYSCGVSSLLAHCAFLIMLAQVRSSCERVSLILIASYKLNYFDSFVHAHYSHVEAKFCYLAILLSGMVVKSKGKKFADISWLLLSALLLREKNAILIPLVYHQAQCVSRLKTRGRRFAAGYLLLSAFFYQGNSNNVTTIDISLGYTGLSAYNEYLVGLLTFTSTFALPVLVIISIITNMEADEDKASFLESLIFKNCVTNAVYSAVILTMRQHLFVWSVFVPKLLYVTAFTFMMTVVHLVVTGTATGTYRALTL